MGPQNYQVVEATGIVEDSGLEGKCRGLYFIIKGAGGKWKARKAGRPGDPITGTCVPRGVKWQGRAGDPGQTRGSGHVPEIGDPRGGKRALAKSGENDEAPTQKASGHEDNPSPTSISASPTLALWSPPCGQPGWQVCAGSQGFTPQRGTPQVQGLDRLLRDYSCAPLGSWMSPLRIPETGGGTSQGFNLTCFLGCL